MRRSGETGLSLLEAIVVLAIFGLMVAAVTPLFSNATLLASRGRAAVAVDADRAALRNVLTTVVARALPPSLSISGQHGPVTLEGSASEVRFTAELPAALGGHLANYTLEILAEAGRNRLVLSWAGRPPADNSGRVVLAEGFDSGRFSYLVIDPQSMSAAQWRDEADGAGQPVQAIRLALIGPGFQDHVISLAIDRNAWCVFDPASLDCRPGG